MWIILHQTTTFGNRVRASTSLPKMLQFSINFCCDDHAGRPESSSWLPPGTMVAGTEKVKTRSLNDKEGLCTRGQILATVFENFLAPSENGQKFCGRANINQFSGSFRTRCWSFAPLCNYVGEAAGGSRPGIKICWSHDFQFVKGNFSWFVILLHLVDFALNSEYKLQLFQFLSYWVITYLTAWKIQEGYLKLLSWFHN